MKFFKITLGLLLGAFLLSSCSSELTPITRTIPNNYEKLGRAEGNACGSLGIAGTAYYFIPMALNSRVERAYQKAVDSVPGATGLVDVTMQENWYWWVIGTARCVTISGEAIK